MVYASSKDCVLDLEKHGQLLRIAEEVDPCLEMAEIHRRVYQQKGPALYFEKVKGSPFPAVSNLYGTRDRCQFIFRKSFARIKRLFELKANPASFFKAPFQFPNLISSAFHALPKKEKAGPVLACTTTIDQIPQIKCWPEDGGAFILLPQVYSEDLDDPGIRKSNLGMYRIQMSGNDYAPNKEIGLHYQIRRDIGIHHTKALLKREKMKVSIFVGGPPANAFSAVMYLPEGLPEVAFAGVLGGRRFRYAVRDGFVIALDADFCITGYVNPENTKPEGPFGDHLGYYSLKHPFPYLEVEKVYHREDAIWPFTVVGRPPQEDTMLGEMVQEIAKPVLPKEIPGVKAVHAVDACGVHPLLLAIGSERYIPYQKRKPQELLTLSHALLGYGPCSLAKFLLIVSGEDDPCLDVHDMPGYFRHLLERVDWRKDLHFQTETTMDTLDYSGTGLNRGSKVVMVAAGDPIRKLQTKIPPLDLPEGFGNVRMPLPGVLVIEAPQFMGYETASPEVKIFAKHFEKMDEGIVWVVLVDEAKAAEKLNDWLWVTFTRSNPSHDVYGVRSFTRFKHWGCEGALIIDARKKGHHAPELMEDENITKKVNALSEEGECLHGIIR